MRYSTILLLVMATPLAAQAPPVDKWEKDIAAFEAKDKAAPPARGGVVFVGSSSIRLWKLADSFPGHPEYLNRGFGGSELADSVKFVDRLVTKHEPKTIVMYAGDNDLAAGKKPEKIRDDYRAFVAAVRAKLPEARIIYLAVKPSQKRWSLADKMQRTNRLIKEAQGDDPKQLLLDSWAEFLAADGKPDPKFYKPDQLHLSDDGYKIWTVKLAKLLETPVKPPNVVFILADDLGVYELGCYGQQKIRTPHIDRLASEGMKFTQFYAGFAVCAPSRCSLLTGKHAGHCWVRDNREIKPEGQEPLPAYEVTIAELFQQRGYTTGAYGKWGLGPPGSTGDPLKQGFDHFYGYNCQRHAHDYYPKWLRDGDRKTDLADGVYAQDAIDASALDFIRVNRDRPFFLFLPFTLPHLALQVPDECIAEYRGKFSETPYDGKKGYKPQPTPRAAYAAMVTRLDTSVGRIMELLEELKLDANTLVCFASDNGVTYDVGGADSPFFGSNGPLRGHKEKLYEGGIRVPFIARWPGRIPAGKENARPLYFADVLPTLATIAGASIPREVDGVDFGGALMGTGQVPRRDYLYWETPAAGGAQAVRMGDWKAVRMRIRGTGGPIELYDLAKDVSESKNVAAEHPEIVERAQRLFREARTPSAKFPLPGVDVK